MTDVVPIEDIKKKVAERVKDMDKPDQKEGGDGSGIDSKFIMQCLNQNELGDGELFKKLFRDNFVFNKTMDRWMRWTGHHWIVDKMDTALASVEKVARVYQDEAKAVSKKIMEADDKDVASLLKKKKDALNKRSSALRATRRRKNCLLFAHTSENPLAIEGDEVDKKPYLLPCKNGVINLKTGELEPGRQRDFLISACQTEWPEEGLKSESPVWDKFLLEIFEDNYEMAAFMMRVLGMGMIGEVVMGAFIVMSGRGRNGKGTIKETMHAVLGKDISSEVRSEMLLDQGRINSSSGPTADIMALRGKRLVFASETDQNCKVSTSRVKWLTGDDMLSGRSPNDKYESNFPPTHTLFLNTNNDPHAPANDYAFWERMIKIPFRLSYVFREPHEKLQNFERRADKKLKKKLKKEYPAILAKLVKGCLEFQKVGLKKPGVVKEAIDKYKRDEDLISDYIDAMCIVGDQYKVNATVVYFDFKEWLKENVSKRAQMSQKNFGKDFGRRFKKKTSGTTTYYGVGLLSELDDQG